MLKVLIVDDEPKAREGVKEFIPWEEYGFYICGEGVDGIDAVKKINSLEPDLVLMDISMPGMDGIDVIKYVNGRGFKGKFIVFTGFSDFEYARSSIKLGVCSYILKPIDEEEFIEAVKHARDEILKEKEVQQMISDGEKNSKNMALRNIILGNESFQQFEKVNSLKKSCEPNMNFQTALIYSKLFLESNAVKEKLMSLILDFIGEMENIDIVTIDNNIVLLIKNTSTSKSVRICERLYKRIIRAENLEIFITIGRMIEGWNNISLSYKDAIRLLEIGFFKDEIKVVSWDNIFNKFVIKSYNPKKKEISDYIEELFTYIEVNDKERMMNILDDLTSYFVRNDYSLDKVKGISINIAVELKQKINANYNHISNMTPPCEEIIYHIYEKSNLYSVIKYLNDLFCSISDKVCNNSTDGVIKRILNYIDKNYYKSLRLEGLAEIFNYNSAYLGKIFKNYTGENFNNYLDKVRIEKAKIMLAEKSIKIYEVSEKVGYSSMNYFYEKFKKHVGVSPMEFRRKSMYVSIHH